MVIPCTRTERALDAVWEIGSTLDIGSWRLDYPRSVNPGTIPLVFKQPSTFTEDLRTTGE